MSTAAITAMIFSLVDRSMASSERDANFSAALYAASRVYAVMVITLRPAASRVYRRALVDFWRRRGLRMQSWLRRSVEPRQRRARRYGALETPAPAGAPSGRTAPDLEPSKGEKGERAP